MEATTTEALILEIIFFEWTIEYNTPNANGFEIVHERYPTKEQQSQFFEHYNAVTSTLSRPWDITQLLLEGETFAMASHFLWGLWGVIQSKSSTISFGYMEYALQRFDGYFLQKARLLKEKEL